MEGERLQGGVGIQVVPSPGGGCCFYLLNGQFSLVLLSLEFNSSAVCQVYWDRFMLLHLPKADD